jgi:hypothetical protein
MSSTEGLRLSAQLRVVGQLIEDLDITDFALQADGADYLLEGLMVPATRRVDSNVTIRFVQSEATGHRIRVRLTAEVIQRLDIAKRALRRSDSGMPNPESSGELLRAIGGLIEAEGRSLKKLARNGETITISSLDPDRVEKREHSLGASFYGKSIGVALSRRTRSA